MRTYYVYILASTSRALYTGMTGDLRTRVWQHKNKVFRGHTSRYCIDHLVYFEPFGQPRDAIAREKQVKRMTRARKQYLIERHNPDWRDLSIDWFR